MVGSATRLSSGETCLKQTASKSAGGGVEEQAPTGGGGGRPDCMARGAGRGVVDLAVGGEWGWEAAAGQGDEDQIQGDWEGR